MAVSGRAHEHEAGFFVLAMSLAFALRVPFLDAGHGWDSDAWRVAASAAATATTGQYAASRFPGNPLPEVAFALLWRAGGWFSTAWAMNGLTALVSSLGAGAFALFLRRAGAPHALLGALALASVPAYFIVSTSTLDYAWASSFGVLGLLCAQSGRAWWTGLFVGLAIASRLTSVLFLPPALFLVGESAPGGPVRAWARAALLALFLGGLAYLPLFREYGLGFLRFYDLGVPPPSLILKKATLDLWGVIGFASVLAGSIVAVAGALRRPRAAPAALSVALWSGVVLFTAAFLRLPYKPAYLVPAVPFALALLALHSSARVFRAVCIGLLVSPWVLSLYVPGKTDDPPPGPLARRVALGGGSMIVDLRGPILIDRERRKEGMRYGARLVSAARTLPHPAIVIAQDWLPQLRVRLSAFQGPVREGGVLFVHQLTPELADSARAEGRAIYYLPGAETTHPVRFGLDARAAGGLPLDLGP